MKYKILILLALLPACAGNIEKFKESEFGLAENYKERSAEIIRNSAKDPYSIEIKNISKPKKTLIQNLKPSALWEPYYPAQGVCVEFYGNNSYGSKVFQKMNLYFIKNEIQIESVTQKQYQPCNKI